MKSSHSTLTLIKKKKTIVLAFPAVSPTTVGNEYCFLSIEMRTVECAVQWEILKNGQNSILNWKGDRYYICCENPSFCNSLKCLSHNSITSYTS